MIEEEDEHQNSPTGSINERREYDIKSEFIRPKAPKFSKGNFFKQLEEKSFPALSNLPYFI